MTEQTTNQTENPETNTGIDGENNSVNTENQKESATAFPEGFPYQDELAENDITTVEGLQKLSDAQIIKLRKIGVRKARVIAEKLAELLAPPITQTAEEIAQESRRAFEESQRVIYNEQMQREKAQYLPAE